MSIRAHRIKEICFCNGESWNAWHNEDQAWMNTLMHDGYLDQLNIDGTGIVSIPVSYLEEALKDKKTRKEAGIHKELRKSLEKDIREAEKEKSNNISYYFF